MIDDLAICRFCGRIAPTSDIPGKWMFRAGSDGGYEVTICPDCYKVKKIGADGQVELEFNYGNLQRDIPFANSFRPVKTKNQLLEARSDDSPNKYWWEAEQVMISLLIDLKTPLFELRFRVSGYERLSIDIERKDENVSGLSFTGDIPAKKQYLNIYQKARLRKMGLIEVGDAQTKWHLSLTGLEAAPPNVARIASHVLQFGWLLNINDASDMTPYVDTEQTSKN
jgi:hypothetical protein